MEIIKIPVNLLAGCFRFFEEPIGFSTCPKKSQKNLEMEMEDLKRIRDVVTMIFQEQEQSRPGTECKVVVKAWLDAVDGIETEVKTLVEDLKKTISCTCCCFPRHNYLLGMDVLLLIERVHALVEERTKLDDDNLVRPIPPYPIYIVPYLPTTMVGRDGKSSEIQGYLSDSEVMTIGIWGMGGIGKTTLMLNSINQWLSGNDHDFHYIIWIEMSQNDDDVLKIQQEIASCIFLSLPPENEERKNAKMLSNALRVRKSLVLIDNVWKKLDFERIGIPSAVGTTVVKILFTTRSESVCNDMRAEKIVCLESLDENESQQLFKRNISPDMIVHQRVDEILKICGGLPLLIVTVARTVANYTLVDLWDHAVESLRMYGSQITREEIEGGCFRFFEEEIRFSTCPKKNEENLEKEMEYLKGIRDVVSTTFQEQLRSRPGTECKVVVKRWLDDVNGIDTEVNTHLKKLVKSRSCTCCFPCHNYFLGKGVVPLIDRVHALVEERKKFDDNNLVRPNPLDPINNVPDQSTTMVGRDGKSSEIQGYLSDSEVMTIGIWGMGGIGKTTLMLKSIKQWLSENDHDFHYIIWIEMSQNDDNNILKIQKRIASCIFLSLPAEHEEWENARMLAKALRSKKSLLLIDNVWKKPNFEGIGIPFRTDFVKILFTTRSQRVCLDMMAQKIVCLDSLDKNVSQQLFKRNISPDMIGHHRVDEILQICAGLPLLIVTVARTVANYSLVDLWDHAVESLRMYGSQITREEIEGGCFKFFEEEIRFSTCLEKNKENLEKEMDKLKRIQRDVSTTFQEQLRSRPGTECKDKVKSWLDAVDGIETKVKTLVDDLKKTISCTCCFPCHNYFLGKGVVTLIERVHALVEQRTEFDNDNLVRPIPPYLIDNVPDLPTTMVGRDGKSSEIHGYLRDSQVTTIGIWGRGGIGKTTMLKSIKQWLSGNDHDFHYIIWIEMSQNDDDILKIQKQIAECIFLSLPPEHEERENARMLVKALRGRKSLLLIDNVWKKLDFERIGIPFAVGTDFVKILFTTRSQKVCHDMRAQKIVRLDSLDQKESQQLFKRSISPVVDLTEKIVRQRVDKILKICGGLPLVIVTVARTVANYTKDEEWDHAVDCLSRTPEEIEGMDDVMKCLKFSYDKLEDDKIKSCLLYLSLYPEGAPIYTDFLIKQWLGEGFLDTSNHNSFTRSYRRGVDYINKLKSICLVKESVVSDTRVKLHDEIRHMLCWIREHENKDVFIVYNDQISDCNDDRWDLAKRIFLLEGQLKGLPETGMSSCRNLTSLFVKAEDEDFANRLVKFPTEDFFHFTPSLRVLDLSYTGIVDIPKSIGELVELRYLNLHRTPIRTLPMELGNLKKLKCLDLGDTEIKIIVGSAISRLSALQSLNLFNTSYHWNLGVDLLYYLNLHNVQSLNLIYENYQWNMTTQHPLLKLEDLRALKNLEDLGVDVMSNSHLNTILCDKMLLDSISRISFVRIDFTTIDLGGPQLIEWISKKLQKLMNLIVDDCDLATDILEIKDDQLPYVTELSLRRLEMSSVTLNDASRPFRRLKKLQIYGCQRLKEVSWTARIHSLENLQVENCNSIRELVVEEEEIREERHYFPKLYFLMIKDLKNLERIHGRSPLLFPALRHLEIENCPKLKQLSFGDDSAKNMEIIECEKIQWDLLEWENDEVRAKFSRYVRH